MCYDACLLHSYRYLNSFNTPCHDQQRQARRTLPGIHKDVGSRRALWQYVLPLWSSCRSPERGCSVPSSEQSPYIPPRTWSVVKAGSASTSKYEPTVRHNSRITPSRNKNAAQLHAACLVQNAEGRRKEQDRTYRRTPGKARKCIGKRELRTYQGRRAEEVAQLRGKGEAPWKEETGRGGGRAI